jgi:hypothetical protein
VLRVIIAPMRSFFRATFLLILISTAPALGQDPLSPDRRINWSQAGYEPGEIPDIQTNIINAVTQYNADNTGSEDASTAINRAIQDAAAPGVVFLPAGNYQIRGTINLKSDIVVRGAGSDKTRLYCDLNGESGKDCFRAVGEVGTSFFSVLSGYNKGSTQLRVGDIGSFSSGSTVELQQDNIPGVILCPHSWCSSTVGQLFSIVSRDSGTGTLLLDRQVHLDFSGSLDPEIRRLDPVVNAGIEDLYIDRTDGGDVQDWEIYSTDIIHFEIAANCWVQRIESRRSINNHVHILRSRNIEVRDSYFHEGYNYFGSKAYGLTMAAHTTSCLAENNIFEHLRHSMSLSLGANGNVLAYGLSIDPYAKDHDNSGNEVERLYADISLHGNYPFMNLFEGNVVHSPIITDWLGPAGPGNTVFRTRIETKNLQIDNSGDTFYSTGSDRQNIIGSEFTGGSNYIRITPGADDILYHGNNADNTRNLGSSIYWRSDLDRNLPDSYYLNGAPSSFEDLPWPPFGPETPVGQGRIPAEIRYCQLKGGICADDLCSTYGQNCASLSEQVDFTHHSYRELCLPDKYCCVGECPGADSCLGTDVSCGVDGDCRDCSTLAACEGTRLLRYSCGGNNIGCVFSNDYDDCSDCSCNCGGFAQTESLYNGTTCSDGIDNDCIDGADAVDPKCRPTAIPNDYVAYWKFDSEANGITPDETGRYNGLVHGAALTNDAKFGSAYAFDGNDYIEVQQSSDLNISPQITITAWVVQRAVVPYAKILVKPVNEGAEPWELYTLDLGGSLGNTPRLAISNGVDYTGWHGLTSPDLILNPNVWYHFAATYDGAFMRLYLNGELIAYEAETLVMGTSAEPIYIGRFMRDTSPALTGSIDELRLYERALSADEILAIYHNNQSNPLIPASPDNLTVVVELTP